MKVKAFFLAALIAWPQLAAVTPAFALSNSRTACMNQWLFNGVWRARITKVEPIMDGANQTGWQVTQTWRNGTSRELSPADSLFKEEDLQLSGTTLQGEAHRQEGLVFNTQAPSGEFTYTQTFFGQNMKVDPNDKPKSLDITFEGDKLATMNKPHFTSRQYNFHYDLGCVASGAKAQAEGGSTQLAAASGCMNQWMSNGVWKMRVLGVSPFPAGSAARDQSGWLVRQEWVNVTRGKTFPGGLADPGNHVAPTNSSDEFLATKGGNNASTANTVGGFHLGQRNIPFLPGVPYTFDQLIAWNPFDASDTPTRLLVTFDTVTQSKTKLSFPVPQYRKPANFRINLACGGSVVSAPGLEALHSPAPAQPGPQMQPAAQDQTASVQQTQSTRPATGADPCAMLSAPDVASALGVGVQTLGTAQRPSANECSWAAASHAGTPSRDVLLVVQPVRNSSSPCHGLGCLHAVQSLLGIPGVPGLPSQFSQAFTDAEIISGLGDKAAWKDGRLTVVKADMAFQLFVHSASPALATSEALARDVLYRLPPP